MSETPARYTTAGGRKLPSVTQILTDVLGQQWRHTEQWHLDRGTAAHALYAIMGRGESLSEYDWDQRLAGHVKHWQEWRETVDAVEVVEKRVQYREAYAGTFDAVVRIKGKLWMIDFKQSSTKRDAVQLAAYALAWDEPDADALPGIEPREKIHGLKSIEIKETGWRVAGEWSGAAQMAKLRGHWQTLLRAYFLKREYH